MNVTSIVLNWNRRDDTLACVRSLEALDTPGVSHRVLLVDNGSNDGTIEAVRAVFPAVAVIALPQNVGYARGVNAGVRRALAEGADWTLLVNNDTVARPDLLRQLLGAAGEPDVGLLAPTVYYFDSPSSVWPSAGKRRPLTLAAFDTTANPPSAAPYDVDWATGCCLLVRRGVWERIGLFDERYRFYYEDHDLCLRSRAGGWRITHVPRAAILHRVAASTGEGSPRQLYLLARGSVPYYLSHTRGAHRVLIVVYRLGSLVRTLLRVAQRRQPAAARAYVRGLHDGWRDWRSPSAKARGTSPAGAP